MNEIISVSNLKKYYGDIKAVDEISFSVYEGELFGFLGVNGAGKSTTISMLCTLINPGGGNAVISGYRLGAEDNDIRNLIGVVWQGNCLDDLLTVRENLALHGSLFGLSTNAINAKINELKTELELDDILGRRYGKLSGGQKRRVEIGAALMNTPKILFLDEPTTGLDPATRKTVWENLDCIRKKTGMTIFLTTHYMEEAACADHISIIDAGKIKEYGTPMMLKEKYAADILRLEPLPAFAKEIETRGKAIPIKSSIDALPILKQYEGKLAGFEVVHGTLDDVFLNVTGKVCE